MTHHESVHGRTGLTVTMIFSLFTLNIAHAAVTDADPAEIAIGERLFLETRFSQAWYSQPGKPDSALKETVTTSEPLPGPFAGQTMNCRACHLVDEHSKAKNGGMRTYADFAHHSPIPNRQDGQHRTPRNSMSLVNITVGSKYGELFHFDGEFNSMEDLVRATLTGRNYGWKPSEFQTAIKHIANIVRNDDGKGELSREFGGSYEKVLKGTANDLSAELKLPAKYRIDIRKANDKQILDAVAKLIAAYVNDLSFSQDADGQYNASPYDHFLQKNNLPRKPGKNESFQAYSQRLLAAVNRLDNPLFVTGKDNRFAYHPQQFEFGEKELKGMKLFFTSGDKNRAGGNCISCHSAPHFSDFSFHNTGLTQHSYDELHGHGSFMKLAIPDLAQRKPAYNKYLPATPQHPAARSPFRQLANIEKPEHADLGLWNVYANPDLPAPQKKIHALLCDQAKLYGNTTCKKQDLLKLAIASFKTPVLRDLGHSEPYMHNGRFTNLQEAVSFYVTSSELARRGQLRNADTELHKVHISTEHINNLVAFLQSLNEDYE